MRLRSIACDPESTESQARLARGKSSKVQNNVLMLGCGDRQLEWFGDLQALGRKGAVTIAKALELAVKPVLQAASRAALSTTQQCRFLHVVTGDGIQTNVAACRRLLCHIRQHAPDGIQYALVMFVCASHVANLVVQTAVMRKRNSEAEHPQSGDVICIAASRYFQHFGASLC